MDEQHERGRSKMCCVCKEERGRAPENRPLSVDLVEGIRTHVNLSFSLQDPRYFYFNIGVLYTSTDTQKCCVLPAEEICTPTSNSKNVRMEIPVRGASRLARSVPPPSH